MKFEFFINKKGDLKLIINCKKIANEIISETKPKVDELHKNGIVPCLAIVMAGNDYASKIYIHNKSEACQKAGIRTREIIFRENISEYELMKSIEKLNNDKSVTGILVQLPLPKHMDEKKVCEIISPAKDVDVFNPINFGNFIIGNTDLTPCTAYGIMGVLKHEQIKISEKHCVVVGRSNIVGKPISHLLLKSDATVTVCHSKTHNLENFCKNADVIVSATGVPKLIKKNMVKNGAVVIDVGINRDENGKLCGDVDFENVEPLCSYITPVPKGIGLVTVAALVHNAMKTACFNLFKNK